MTVTWMSIFARRLSLALLLAVVCLGNRTAHAQAAPVTYWLPGWPLGFGGNLGAGQGSSSYGNFPSFDGGDTSGGVARFNLGHGFFAGSESGNLGLNGFGQAGAFGSLRYDGMQFGYNFQNSPVTVFGGFNTLKYDTGLGGAFGAFDSKSGTLPVYSAHAGVEFQAAPNVNVSLGFGYTQQTGRIDTDSSLPSLSGASPFDLVGGRH